MLSAEERRRLDEIERLLQRDDPRFVARMEADPRARRKWVVPAFYGLLWLVALVVGAAVSWVAALIFTALVGLVGSTVLAVAVVRRRRRDNPPAWPAPR
ncbi:MAG TPA: DUF3040 domain-containing protein [Pilimelia sp.]|nr:DUF3040 domain-containing protein [Pilimelia sp.]